MGNIAITKDPLLLPSCGDCEAAFGIGDGSYLIVSGAAFSPRDRKLYIKKTDAPLECVVVPEDTLPALTWRSLSGVSFQVQWPSHQWDKVIPPKGNDHLATFCIPVNNWRQTPWHWGPLSLWNQHGQLNLYVEDAGPACLVVPSDEIYGDHGSMEVPDINLMACVDRAFQAAFNHGEFQFDGPLPLSNQTAIAIIELYFAKRNLPKLRQVILPDHFELAQGWKRYLENCGVQPATSDHRKPDYGRFPDVAANLSTEHQHKLIEAMVQKSPIVPGKLTNWSK